MPWSLRYIVVASEEEPDDGLFVAVRRPEFRGSVSTKSRRELMDALDDDWEPFAAVADGFGAVVLWFRRMDQDASLEQIDPKDLPGHYL